MGDRDAPLATSREGLLDDVLSILHTYRDYEPEEDESWESWYFAAFDLACMKVRELFGRPAIAWPVAQPQRPDAGMREALSDIVRFLRGTNTLSTRGAEIEIGRLCRNAEAALAEQEKTGT